MKRSKNCKYSLFSRNYHFILCKRAIQMKTTTKVIRNWFGYQRKLERKDKNQKSNLKIENLANKNPYEYSQTTISSNIPSKPFYNYGLPHHFFQKTSSCNMNILGIGYLLVPRNPSMIPRNCFQNQYNFF